MDTLFKIESLNAFQTVSQEILTGLYYSGKAQDIQIEYEVFEKAKCEMKTIISDSKFDIQKVVKTLHSKGWPQERITYFVNFLEKHWSELLNSALHHYNSSYGVAVINYDWLVKLVLGTSELKTLQYPLLQLILSTVNKIGEQNRIMYDIKKDMLLKLINTLENIQL